MLPAKYKWEHLKYNAVGIIAGTEDIDNLSLKTIILRLQFKKFENWVTERMSKENTIG